MLDRILFTLDKASLHITESGEITQLWAI